MFKSSFYITQVLVSVLALTSITSISMCAGLPPGPDPTSDNPPLFHYGSFDTSGQNIWASGKALDIDHTEFFGLEWGSKEVTLAAGSRHTAQGFVAGKLHAGRVGLEADLDMNAGSVDVHYPIRSWFEAPSSARWGDTISIDTNYSILNGISLDTIGPEAEFKLDFVNDYDITYGAGIDTGVTRTWTTSSKDNDERYFDQDDWQDGNLFDRHRNDKTLFSSGGEQRKTLLHIGSGISSTSLSLGRWGQLDFQIPEAESAHDGTLNNKRALTTSTTSDPWVSLDADLDKLAANLFPALEALNGDLSIGPIDFDYSILSADLEADVRLKQEFTFQVESIDVTMVEHNSGLVVSGKLGDSLEFTVPGFIDELDWDVTLAMNGKFTNRTSILIEGEIDYELLSLEADLGLLGELDLGPVVDGTIPWSIEAEVFKDSFALKGFNSMSFDYRSTTVNPNKYGTKTVYSGIPTGGGYSLHASPVPEPTSIIALISGCLLLPFFTRRIAQFRKLSHTWVPSFDWNR